ncbi:MAG: S8 family serine peptidase [Candidatus Bathyarchaeia archaeon]
MVKRHVGGDKTAGKIVLKALTICLLLTCFFALTLEVTEAVSEKNVGNAVQCDLFTPAVWKPAWIDKNNNNIADDLDMEISEKKANGTAQDYVNVTVMLNKMPTAKDTEAFISLGGYLTTPTWKAATYGFGGRIQYSAIEQFIQQCSSAVLVEKDAVGKVNLAYATQQIGARTYVWNTLNLQGDPNASTAIIDTGIDATHIDFAPGYGNQDFSKKIIGWTDTASGATAPVDDNGHGSHVAGIVSGNGFFSVDTAGYATSTWGTSLTLARGYTGYSWTGIIVNNTGTITLNIKWLSTGTVKLSALSLYEKSENTYTWTEVASINTPNRNTWYSLSFNVTATPSTNYKIYNPRIEVAGGTGRLYVVLNMSWPYNPPADGFSAWTGVAPRTKLVGVKALNSAGEGTATSFINAINWIIANRMTYHITVASMSLSFDSENSQVNTAVLNLVNSGVTVVASAGNDGAGSNYIYSPGSIDEVITVAAMNQFDSITQYSSQGGTSSSGKTIKPDITAPGGSYYGVPIFSADSNYNDAEGGFTDVQANDATPLMGTSMAAPFISGCVQILLQAMGGFEKWNWTRSQALLPKMILLMTATETYPNLRETETATTSPLLNRGSKDAHEGYGRVNLDAAVDAVLKTYQVGTTVTDTLGMPPTPLDISVLGQKLAWARNVQLTAGSKYSFTLEVPTGADYDLYLYNSTGTLYGEPAIVAKSTNATTGGIEQFGFTAPYSGTYYIVVKRATETTGSGTFTLSSQGAVMANVTLYTPGLPNATNVVHYIQNGSLKTGSINASTFSDYVDVGTTLTIDNIIAVSETERYITTEPTTFLIQTTANFTINYKTQFYISVYSSHGNPTASDWVSQGGSYTVSVISPADVIPNSSRWVCLGYSIDGSAFVSGNNYTFINVQSAHNITFNWRKQFWIQVNSLHGSPPASAWINEGDNFTVAVASPAEVSPNEKRWICIGYSIDSGNLTAGTTYLFMNVEAAHTIEFYWKQQFFLTVNSPYGSPSGSGWYDDGSITSAILDLGTVSGGKGIQHVFTGWSGDASGTGLTSNAIVMNQAKTATANWKTQYYLTTSTVYGTVSGGGWYDAGTSAFATISPLTVTENMGTQHVFAYWSGDATGETASSNAIVMDRPKTAIANWKTQYYLNISANFGSVEPHSGWYDSGSKINIYATAPLTMVGERYIWNGWINTNNGNVVAEENSTQIILNTTLAIAASWTKQYMLTVSSLYGKPVPQTGWFNDGTKIEATVDLVVPGTLVNHVCVGWIGTGSVPESGTTAHAEFVITQPSSITWKWEQNYLTGAIVVTVTVVTAMAGVGLYLLLRKRQKTAQKIDAES